MKPISNDTTDDAATAAYIAEMSADMAVMARRCGHQTLGRLLEMASLEARYAVANRATKR